VGQGNTRREAADGGIAQAVDANGVAQTRDLTALTGRTTPRPSSARQALIDKRLAESAGHARLMFTMPGFAESVRPQVDVTWYGPADWTTQRCSVASFLPVDARNCPAHLLADPALGG